MLTFFGVDYVRFVLLMRTDDDYFCTNYSGDARDALRFSANANMQKTVVRLAET